MNFDKMFKGFEVTSHEIIEGEIDRYVLHGSHDYGKRLEYVIYRKPLGLSKRLTDRLEALRYYLDSCPLGGDDGDIQVGDSYIWEDNLIK